MKHVLRKMSPAGDEQVAEWTEATSKEELQKIEAEFTALRKAGYFAADMDKAELIRDFDPEVNIVLIPRVAGGRV